MKTQIYVGAEWSAPWANVLQAAITPAPVRRGSTVPTGDVSHCVPESNVLTAAHATKQVDSAQTPAKALSALRASTATKGSAMARETATPQAALRANCVAKGSALTIHAKG